MRFRSLGATIAELYPEATAATEAERTRKRLERLRARPAIHLEGDDYRRQWKLEEPKGD